MTTKAFTIRADEDLIKSFHHACTNTDTTASQAVRAFMREYIKKNGQGDLFATKGGKWSKRAMLLGSVALLV